MNLTCPECKNALDLSVYPTVAVGHIIECNTCGITLLVRKMEGTTMEVEVVDEGK